MDEIYDYRRTRYCPELLDVKERKNIIVKLVEKNHPHAEDMHNYVSDNSDIYKKTFMQAYNGKCAYCGVSADLLPKNVFEIDHFLYEKAPCFKTKKEAGYIDNLVLACHDCNHRKSSFWIEKEDYEKLHPDGEGIKKSFVRDELFYIRVNNEEIESAGIIQFYDKLQLGSELHRLDYLLMNIIGMQRKYQDNDIIYAGLGRLFDVLRKKRNFSDIK